MELKPGYKGTEVGVIPDNWEVAQLDEVVDPHRPISYGVVQTGPDVPDGIPCLRVVDISNGVISKNGLIRTSKAISDSYRRTILKIGDLVMPLRGDVGDVGMVDIELEGANLTRGVALIAVRERSSAPYCRQFLSWSRTRVRLSRAMNGSALQEIPIAVLRAFKVAWPPVSDEQRAIAAALSDVDALLDGLDRLIAKKRDLKLAAMQQLLTGQTRLPGFQDACVTTRLGETGAFVKGAGVRKVEATSGALPCVRYGEIYTHHDDYIRDFNSWISPDVAATATRLSKGDLLFAGSGETKEDIGKCVAFLGDHEAYAGGDIVILRPTCVDAMFMGYVCNTEAVRSQKASKGQGDAVVHITASALAAIEVSLPGLAEQTAIAEVLSDMDAEIAALEARRAKTRDLKQAMMQELLTGRTRLIAPVVAAG